MKLESFLLICLVAVACSCNKDNYGWGLTSSVDSSKSYSGASDEGSDVSTDVYSDEADDISQTSFASTITITFSKSGNASVSGDSNGLVSVSGNDVTAKYEGEQFIKYILEGSTEDGFFKLYSTKKAAIVLNGVSITNPAGAAINNQSGKRTFLVVEGENYLADGSSYTDATDDEDMKAALFSEGQLVFSGSGSLEVEAKGKAGITSDDYLRFLDGPSISVTSSAGHGVRGKDAVIISGGTLDVSVSADMKKAISSDGNVQIDGGETTLNVTGSAAYDSDDEEYTGTAGIKADVNFIMNDGSLEITNSGKGGKGISTDDRAYFKGGTVKVTTSGSNYSSSNDSVSAKGIKCDGNIYISGGDVQVQCAAHEGIESKGTINISGGTVYSYSRDDAINSKGELTIDGGCVRAHATNNDGIDANKSLIINGGVVIAEGCGGAENGLDAAEGYTIYINGGYVVATGGSTSQTASGSAQASVAGSASKGQMVSLCDGDKLLLTYNTSYVSTSAIMFSCPSLEAGNSYTLKTKGTISGGETYFNIFTVGGTLSGGSTSSTLTAAKSVGTAMGGGMGGPGGGMGGPGGGW